MKLPDGRIAKVFHLRLYTGYANPEYGAAMAEWENKEKRPYSKNRKGLVPLTKGGKTVVQVLDRYDQEHIVAEGKAYCHPGDNYNRRLGVQIALGRALKVRS
jgi:hypothetical protein